MKAECQTYTETHLYQDLVLGALYDSVERMEKSGWSVRLTEVLEPLHEVKKVVDRDVPPMTVQILTILVVYEREQF